MVCRVVWWKDGVERGVEGWCEERGGVWREGWKDGVERGVKGWCEERGGVWREGWKDGVERGVEECVEIVWKDWI